MNMMVTSRYNGSAGAIAYITVMQRKNADRAGVLHFTGLINIMPKLQ